MYINPNNTHLHRLAQILLPILNTFQTLLKAAALPMQSLVAFGAVKAAGLLNKPLLDNLPHKEATPWEVNTSVNDEYNALITKVDRIN